MCASTGKFPVHVAVNTTTCELVIFAAALALDFYNHFPFITRGQD